MTLQCHIVRVEEYRDLMWFPDYACLNPICLTKIDLSSFFNLYLCVFIVQKAQEISGVNFNYYNLWK